MTEKDLMFAFQCCAPSNKHDRDCYICPFSNSTDCHAELCASAISYIMHEQGKTERFARGVDSVVDAVNNLHSLY